MIPVLAISAWSGTGKTSLLKKLIPALCAKG
ncbi:molybdopterin-guanine dinucleotide biosynthesis protein MobB, partial [Enterobacter hormaechei subsp. xiangfangensis]